MLVEMSLLYGSAFFVVELLLILSKIFIRLKVIYVTVAGSGGICVQRTQV